MHRLNKAWPLLAACVALTTSAAISPSSAEALPGPILAQVVHIVDGDTLTVRAEIWPGIEAYETVRVLGIDAPEMKGACESERALAREAKGMLQRLAGARVWLSEIGRDRYGRILARVYGGSGELGEAMIQAGLARPYDGGRRRGWC